MMAASLFDIASLTRTGGRRENEDYADFLQTDASSCWIVADGLGGHRGGATASRTVVQAALASFRERGDATAEAVAQHVARAQEALLAAQRAEPSLAQMRSTIVVLVSTAEHAAWAHVGDSRLYHLSGGAIAARTRDHSVSQALVDGGRIDARDQGMHEDRGRLLRCLGKEDESGPTIATVGRLYRGDTFLLCTDGFWESVDDLAVEIDLAASEDAAAWLDRMEARLRRANGASRDNFTAIAVRVIGETAPLPPPHDPQVPPAWTGGHRPRADAPPLAASGSSRLAALVNMRVLVAAAAILVVLTGAGVWKRDVVRAWAHTVWTKVIAAAASGAKDAPENDTEAEKPKAAENPKPTEKPDEAENSSATGAADAEKPARAAEGDKPKPSGEAKEPASASDRPADASGRDGKDSKDDRATAPATKKPASASDRPADASGRDGKDRKDDRATAPATKKKPAGASDRPTGAFGRDGKGGEDDRVTAPAAKKKPAGAAGKDGG